MAKKTKTIKSYFLTGILVSAPLAITVYLAIEFVRFIDEKVNALIPKEYNPATYLPFGIPGFGILILLIGLFLIGVISSGFIGTAILKGLNKAISKMPVVSGLYNALQKILETVVGGGQNKLFEKLFWFNILAKGYGLLLLLQEMFIQEFKNISRKKKWSAFMYRQHLTRHPDF